MLCQDREPFAQDWVDAAGDWDGGSLALETRREPVRATVYRPDLGGLLPVYVADNYDGIQAKPFAELTDDELAAYLDRNVAAAREVAERVRPDIALANHLVMGPCVVARALDGVPYAVKVHGSALEYTVKPNPERFLPYAREGLADARAILVGSRHTAESLWAAMDDPTVEARTRLGPPGVDIEEFQPREPAAARRGLEDLVARLALHGAPRGRVVVRPRPRRCRRRPAGHRAGRPARRLRRQADRLQGRRPAARRLAAHPRAGARRQARGRRLRRLPGGAGAARRRPLRRGSRGGPRHPRRERARAALPAGFPRRRARGIRGRSAPDGVGRAARPRRARRPAARLRGDRGAEHVPRGVRDGGRRGRGLRRAARGGEPQRPRRGRHDALGRRPGGRAAAAQLRARTRRGARAGRRRRRLARGARRSCAPPPARRWWRSPASATPGTASPAR